MKNNLEILKSEEIIKRMMGGMMNESYLIKRNGNLLVYYSPQGNANSIVDRKLENKYQVELSKLNITSKNIYVNFKTGVKINHFIPGDSLNNINNFDYSKIAKLLHVYHSSKIKTKVKYSPLEKLLSYEKQVNVFFKLSNDFYYLKNLVFANNNFLRSREICPCHNDFQRSNIIKGIDNKYYVIDFEFASLNDPIFDIAAFGNNSVSEGRKLLDAYFEGKPKDDEVKAYYLWRICLSLQWHLVALIKDYNKEGEIHKINFKDIATFFLNNALEASKFVK